MIKLDSLVFILTLRFYTDWRNFEINKMVDNLTKKQPSSASYPLLELIITTGAGEKKKLLALNEATIKRVSKTLKADVYIRDQFLKVLREMAYVFLPLQVLLPIVSH